MTTRLARYGLAAIVLDTLLSALLSAAAGLMM
jgi:hypothetical protein